MREVSCVNAGNGVVCMRESAGARIPYLSSRTRERIRRSAVLKAAAGWTNRFCSAQTQNAMVFIGFGVSLFCRTCCPKANVLPLTLRPCVGEGTLCMDECS